MSDTPRTDWLANSREPWAVFGADYFTRLVEHASGLERELAAAQEMANRETMNAAYFAARLDAAKAERVAVAEKCAEICDGRISGEVFDEANDNESRGCAADIRAYAKALAEEE